MNPYLNLILVVLITMTGMLAMLAAIRKVPEGHRGVLFRMGRLVKELPPGMTWVMPVLDSVMLVNMDEQTIALPDNLTIPAGDKHYALTGTFTCKIIEPIPAVMAALQARQDLAVVVGHYVLDELKRLGAAAALERPEQARKWVVEALNERMSPAWQVKFTGLELKLDLQQGGGRLPPC